MLQLNLFVGHLSWLAVPCYVQMDSLYHIQMCHLVCRHGLLSTPAVSAVIRKRKVCLLSHSTHYVHHHLFHLSFISCSFHFSPG
jgi:hypothetical protein